MAVIPRDAVQMPPPRAAAPGLPPVDPARRPPPRPIGEGRRETERRLAPVADEASEDGPSGRRRGMPEPPDGNELPASIPRQTTFVAFDAGKAVSGEKQADPLPAPFFESIPDGAQKDWRSDPSMGFDGIMEAIVSEITSRAYDPSMDFPQGAEPIVFCDFIGDDLQFSGDVPPGAETAPVRSSGGFGASPKVGSPSAGKPTSRSTQVPPRIAERPCAEEWPDDELLTLPEAAALFWPAGPITTNTLRTAGCNGTLAITKVAGKFFTTPMAIRRMGQDETDEATGRETAPPTTTSPQATFKARTDETRLQGRERKRRQRAAKRSVAPSDPEVGR